MSQTLVNQLWQLELNYPDTVEWNASILDGGYLITTGNTWNGATQKTNIVTTKTNQGGSIVWQTEYNGTASGFDYGAALIKDGSGNIFVAGATNASDDYTYDIVVIKYNSIGVQQWATTFDGTGAGNDIPSDILLIGTDIYVCAASIGITTGYDYLLLKLNSGGTVQWNKRYDYTSLYDIPGHLISNGGTNIVVSGASQSSATNWDYTSLKYNPSGTLIQTQRSSAAGYGFDRPTGLVTDGSDNFYITGYTYNGTDYDMRTIKLDEDLSPVWTVSENDGGEDGSNAICIDGSDNIYIAGYAENSADNRQIKIVKYNSGGTLQWEKILQNSSNDIEAQATGITYNSTSDRVVITGFYEYTSGKKVITTFALRTDNGNLTWKKEYPNLGESIDIPTNVLANNNYVWVYGRRTVDDTTRYVTVKYETWEKPNTNILDSLDRPIYRDNEVIIRFNPELLDKNFIDNKQQVYTNLADVLIDTTYDKIASLLKGNGVQFTPKAIKIYKQFTSNDSTSISRTGETIKLTEFWASILVTCDPSVDEFNLSDTLSNITGEILYAHPNWIGFQFDDANDEDYNTQLSLFTENPDFVNAHIEIEDAWDIEVGDENIKVGILDNSIDWSHEDFGDGTLSGSKIKGGFDFANSVDFASMGLPTSNDHATNVAGIIGALRNNEIGIAGIAGGDNTTGINNEGVSIYSLKCFYEDAILSVTSLSEALVTSSISGLEVYQGLNILNLSGGFLENAINEDTPEFRELQSAVDLAYRNEVVFVTARGQVNQSKFEEDGDELYAWPASFLQNKNYWTICVGAAGNNGERKTPINSDPSDEIDEFYSLIGGGIDLIAPGTSDLIWTTGISSDADASNDYIVFRNSSAAAPHVAGVAALMLSYVNDNPMVFNNLSPEDVEWIIQESADNFPTSEYPAEYDDFTGHGMLNATNALEWLELPYNKIIHYPISAPTSLGYYRLAEPDYIKIFIADPPGGLAAGVYLAEVWDVDFVYNHSIPATATFIAGWIRNSTTTGLEPIDLEEEDYIIPSVTNIFGSDYLDDFDISSTTAKIKSRVYRITYTQFGTAVTPFYYPNAPEDVEVNYSIYINDPAATNIETAAFNDANVVVFPNPTNELLNIIIDDHICIERIDIFNMNGEKVFSKNNFSIESFFSININFLSSGLYNIQITTNNKSFNTKIIKY
ncbi:MAG: S8 family serine peptidase [Bacteroidetes bacterium]|nr:S8 family serine peptidase [Bacteroidota bacterium]